jgi:hypothetical protein
MERMKANFYAKKIKEDENCGSGNVHVLEDDWDKNDKFWKILDSNAASIKENSDVDDQEFEVKFNTSNFKLYRFDFDFETIT